MRHKTIGRLFQSPSLSYVHHARRLLSNNLGRSLSVSPAPDSDSVAFHPFSHTKTSSYSTTPAYSSSTSSSTTQPSSFCDVLVLGGGMVGGALACVLADHPAFRDKKTIVLERGKRTASPATSDDAPFSNRVCELSPASVRFLDSVGVWKLIEAQRYVYTISFVWIGHD